ncbi:MAG: sodium/proline symporter [Treponema sp.]|nr:sodium/proline symporter [Treponema sp.]
MVGTVVIFTCYLVILLLVGVFFFGKNDSLTDYFIGGRRLNPWVAAISAYASDMSGWLFLGFIGAIYAFGLGQIWIAVGLVLGTIFNWVFVAGRLRRYSITAGSAITIPEFLENRFADSSHLLRFVSSVIIIIFFTIYTASGFIACGALFSAVLGINYQIALLVSFLIILAHTFLGGFRAVCWTNFFQGILMLISLIGVTLIVFYIIGGFPAIGQNINPEFLNIFLDKDGQPLHGTAIVSGLAWGLGYFGMPHILVRFMALKNEHSIIPAAIIGGLASIISLGFAAFMGIAGLVLNPGFDRPESIFIRTIQSVFIGPDSLLSMSVPGGIFLCGIFAAIMSTADSHLLVTASSITNDLYEGIIRREKSDRHFLWFSRFSVLLISVLAYIIAVNRNFSVMALVSNAWSGLGSCFGALVLLSLYWRRINRPGAIAGILSGGFVVILWDYIICVPCSGGALSTFSLTTGIYSLAPGFCVSFVSIIVVSLFTRKPSREILDQFEQAAAKPFYEE